MLTLLIESIRMLHYILRFLALIGLAEDIHIFYPLKKLYT